MQQRSPLQAPASRAVSLAIECRKIPSRKMCKPTAPISSPSSETPTVPRAKYLMKAFVLELRIYQHRPDLKHGHTRRTDNLGTETLPGHMGHTQQPSTFSAAKAPGEADSGDSYGEKDHQGRKDTRLYPSVPAGAWWLACSAPGRLLGSPAWAKADLIT